MSDRPSTRVFELDEPIEFGNQTFDRFEMKRPQAGQMAKVQEENKSPMSKCILLVSLVSGITRGAVEKMPADVIEEAAEWCADFFGRKPPATGES